MPRPYKVGTWLIGISLACLTILFVAVTQFNGNWLKPFINEKVCLALGRPFAINGDLNIQWHRDPTLKGWRAMVPWPQFTAHDITVGNPPGNQTLPFAHLHTVRFRLSPLGLLTHRLIVPQLQLGLPSLNLTRNKQGRANWDFTLPASKESTSWQLILGTIIFDRGQATLDDRQNAIHLTFNIRPLQRTIPYNQLVAQQASATIAMPKANTSYMFAWMATGIYKNIPFKGVGKIGAVLALQRNDQPFPLQADMRFGDSHIVLAGTLIDPMQLGTLDLQLHFSGSSMAKLYPIIGIALPNTPSYETTGQLHARISARGSRFSYEHFVGRVGNSDLSGDLVFDTSGVHPKLSGKLYSKQWRFADLAPLIGADNRLPKETRSDTTTISLAANKLLPSTPFHTDRWQTMDADVYFRSAHIISDSEIPIQSLNTHLVLEHGNLTLQPFDVGLAGGTVKGRINLDGSHMPMHSVLQLHVRHLQLEQLFPKFTLMQSSFGQISGDITLQAQGNSVASLLGHADGELKILLSEGAISKTLLEMAGLNIGNIVLGKMFGDKTVKIYCAAADLIANQGQIKTKLFVLDTSDAIVQVNGIIDLTNEQLNLTVRPQTKGFRLFSLRSPLYVKGTFKQPKVGVQLGTLLLRSGGAIALGTLAAPAAALLPLAVPNHYPDSQNVCHMTL